MDGRRLDLNLLVALEALLAERNVTRAAARLHLSQPAVSAQLGRLRMLFDDPLLIPARRGMVPTAKALDLLDPLRGALDGVRATLDGHRHFDPQTARLTVSIACTDYLQRAMVGPLLAALRERAPGVRLALRHLEPARLEAQMASGLVDLALMTPADGPGGLRHQHLFDEHYVLIGRRRHPALRPGLSAAQFAELDQIVVSLGGGEFATPVDDALRTLGLRRHVVLSASSFLVVPELVAGSAAVALVPARLVQGARAALTVVASPVPMPGFAVGMLWHERNHGHAGQRWLRDLVADVADRP